MEKVTGTTFLAGAMAEVLTIFSLGILICIVLYTVASFCEALLARHKLRLDRSESTRGLTHP